ncbi:MAG: trypsin-like peptidase domain-containing protein [Planctomycetota bacterium JB042]
MSRLVGIALVVALPLAGARAEEPRSPLATGVVKLLVNKATMVAEGCGFAVAGDRIVTCRHVVQGAVGAEVVLADHRRFDVREVLAVDRYWDLALLRIDAAPDTLAPLPLGEEPPPVGGEVAAWVPLRFSDDFEGDEESPRPSEVRRGTVVRHRPLDGGGTVLRLTTAFDVGDSGTPLLDPGLGRVLGVLTMYVDDGGEREATFAVPAPHVRRLLERARPEEPFADSLFAWQRRTADDPEWLVETASLLREDPRRGRRLAARKMLGNLIERHADDDPPTLAREAYHAFAYALLVDGLEAEEEAEARELLVRATAEYRRAIDAPALSCFDDIVLSLSIFGAASASLQVEEVDDARRLIDRYVAREPDDPDGHALRAWTAVAAGDRAGAERSTDRLAELLGAEAADVVELRESIGSLDEGG